MPKRKRLPKHPDYTGLPRKEEALLIQKSNPLLSLTQSKMTLPEFKILDVYLSRIDSHDEEKRYVRFEKGELEKLLGVSRILKEDLEKRLENLFQVLTIQDPDKPKGFTKIGLFAKAEAVQDEDGLWQVDLACTQEAREYVFNIEHLGYIRYRLHSVVNLTSRYSYALFLYLEDNRFRKSWDVDLEQLKKILRCDEDANKEFKFFNRDVLKRSQIELHEKTDLRFSYRPIQKGYHKTVGVHFEVEVQDQIPGQLTLADVQPDPDMPNLTTREETIEFIKEAITERNSSECEFNDDELNAIFELLVAVPDFKLPMPELPIILRRYHYFSQVYARMVAANSRHPIKHRFSYLCKLIKGDQ
jgi:hypothetical protein